MERVGNTMTLIGKAGATPQPGGPKTEETPKAGDVDMVAMGRAFRRLEALYKATKLIASEFDLDNRLSSVLDTAMEVVEAERGFIMLRDEATGGLRMHVARAMGQDVNAGSPSMSVAGRAAIHGEPVLMSDRDNDSRFSGSESIIMQQIRSAMAVPLKVEDRILGSIYVDTRSLKNPFQEEDLELFASFAAQSAMAIDNVRLYEQMVEAEKRRANLGRFLSPSIVEAIVGEHQEMALGGTKRTVTTLFSDIRGFTSIAEKMTPEELIFMLNEHFTASTETVFLNEGTLDKYIGDCVMAVFGSPFEKPDDALRCVRAAMDMMKRNAELNEVRAKENRPQLQIGIGIDTGEVNSGLMGSPDRLEFAVVGDSVNTASRLCSKAEPGQVLIGERTYALVKDRVIVTPMGAFQLKGKEAGVQVYKVESIND
jgi:adenylate cyclase